MHADSNKNPDLNEKSNGTSEDEPPSDVENRIRSTSKSKKRKRKEKRNKKKKKNNETSRYTTPVVPKTVEQPKKKKQKSSKKTASKKTASGARVVDKSNKTVSRQLDQCWEWHRHGIERLNNNSTESHSNPLPCRGGI